MRKLLYILALLPLFLLSACADDKEVVALLDRAEALMEAAPDSASRLLHAADSTIARQSEPTRMRHAVLLAQANNKLYQPLPSDTTFQEVVDYYDRHGSPNQQLLAHYLLGCIYRDRGEAPQALQCYYDAIEKADTLSEDCDYTTLYKVYGQMADIFEDEVMPDEEIEALSQYSRYALKAGNIYEYIHGIELTALPYDFLRDTTMILSTEKKVHDLYEKYGFTKEATAAYGITIYICIKKGHYEKARQLMQAFENQPDLYDKEGNVIDGRENYYNARGQYYLGIGQLDSAEHEFKRLIPYGYTYNAYRGLLDVSLAQRDLNAAFSYLKLYEAALDTLVTDIHAEATRQAIGMYDYTRHQKIAAQKTAETERQKMFFYVITSLFILAGIILYHFWARAKARRMAQARLLAQQLTTMSSLYRKTKEELEIMDNDLSAYKVQKQEELDELHRQLKQLQKKQGEFKQTECFEALKQSPIIETLNERLKPTAKSNILTEKEWDALIDTFWQYMPSLTLFLEDKQTLTPLELRAAILTRLNFRPDDIALLLNISRQHVSNLKGSANKKLFSDGSARTFFQNLCKI